MTDFRGSFFDDDGVLVVSTARQMEIIGSRGFDYDFPDELLTLMNEGRIVAWETGGEGKFHVEVTFAEEPPSGAKGAFPLSVLPDDTGIVMPYSQFTYAADSLGGTVEYDPGLALRYPIATGEYHVFISLAAGGFRVTITPARHTLAPITDDLPFLRSDGV